jgi:hypothetical protein
MRRLAVAAAVVGSLLAISCSTDQPQEPQAPTEPSYTIGSDINRLCSTTTDPIQVQICAIFTRPLQFLTATSFYVAIKFEKRRGHERFAQALAAALVNITFNLYNKNKLVPGTTWDQVVTFTCDLLTFVGSNCGGLAELPPPQQNIHSTVVVCTSAGCLVRPEDRHSGVLVGAGACPSICIISVNPIFATIPLEGPLDTELDEYGLFRHFAVATPSSGEFLALAEFEFAQPVLVGICHLSPGDGDFAPPDAATEARLRLARNNVDGGDGGGIEIFNKVAAPFLSCGDLNSSNEEFVPFEGSGRSSPRAWFASAAQSMYRRAVLPIIRKLLPEPAEAAVGACCLGALTNKVSEWGAVDPQSGGETPLR